MNDETKISSKSLVSSFRKVGIERIHHENTDIFEIHAFNLTKLKLDVGVFTPFFFPKSLSGYDFVSNDTLLDLIPVAKAYVNRQNRKFGVLVLNSNVRNLDEIAEEFTSAKIALLTKKDQEELLKVNRADLIYNKLGLVLTNYLGRDLLNPYIPGRPAIGGRFFARSNLTKEILNTKNHYTIVGNRRIGKTSLLSEVSTRLKKEDRYRIIELYGGKWTSIEDVMYELYIELDMHKQANDLEEARLLNLSSKMVIDFPRHIYNEIKKENRPIAFFIDEFDHVVEIDEKKGHKLIHIFREMTIKAGIRENCRFFFAGFRKTKKAKESITHPLHNFGKYLPLEPFSRSETYDMISTPLTRLGIQIADDISETIYNQTGGLPELIQIYCAEILSFFNEKNRTPSSQELLKEVADSAEFKHKIHSSFLANANHHEQLLCYLLIQKANEDARIDHFEFNIEDVEKLLTSKSVYLDLGVLNALIDNLKDSAIIENAAGTRERYKFIVPQLANYITNLNLEFEINKILSTISERSILDEPDLHTT